MTPFLSLGFRPFYLAAAAFASLAIPVWIGHWLGWLVLDPALPAMAWHVHEMVFGFAPAVIAGFLLTSVRAWTGRETLQGGPLLALVGLWLAARLTMATGPAGLALVLDLAFLPLLALALAVPLWRSRNLRNAFVVPLLLVLGLLSAAHQGAWRGWLDPVWGSRSWVAGLDLVALLITVIGGRVIPVFSANAIKGLQPRRWPIVEALAIGLVVLLALLDGSGFADDLPPGSLAALLLLAGSVHLLRLAGWQPWAMRSNLLLMALPLGYLWLPVHLLLRGALMAPAGQPAQAAVHALAVGAMAGLMLAMMTRSSLGHTGRALVAGRREAVIFAAIHVAALTRVLAHLTSPGDRDIWLQVSAGCWLLAFATFVVVYGPMLARPRLPG